MKIELMVKELSRAAQSLGLKVIFDAGNFRGGTCEVKNNPYLVLNKRHPAEVHFGLLAAALRAFPAEAIAVRPVVLKALESVWARQSEENLTPDLDIQDG